MIEAMMIEALRGAVIFGAAFVAGYFHTADDES